MARYWGRRLGLVALVLASLGSLASAFGQTLTVLTHDSFAISEEVMAEFTAATGIEVRFVAGGDAGEVVNRAILTKAAPIADLLYGIDNSLLARAVHEGIFEPYESPRLAEVAPEYRFDPQHFVTPIDVGFVTFNYDKAFFAAAAMAPPSDLVELTQPAYRGLTVVENPASSSPGLAFMLATIYRFGEAGGVPARSDSGWDGDWLDFWAALRDNELLVVDGWTEAYYTAFSRYGGDRPVVLSYTTSPPAEVIFAEQPLDEAPTANLLCPACSYRQIEAVGILAGTKQREAAEKLIDFMLSPRFQEDVPLNMFVYPVVTGAAVPPEFARFGPVPTPEQVAELPSELVVDRQLAWLDQWTQVVLQERDPADVR